MDNAPQIFMTEHLTGAYPENSDRSKHGERPGTSQQIVMSAATRLAAARLYKLQGELMHRPRPSSLLPASLAFAGENLAPGYNQVFSNSTLTAIGTSTHVPASPSPLDNVPQTITNTSVFPVVLRQWGYYFQAVNCSDVNMVPQVCLSAITNMHGGTVSGNLIVHIANAGLFLYPNNAVWISVVEDPTAKSDTIFAFDVNGNVVDQNTQTYTTVSSPSTSDMNIEGSEVLCQHPGHIGKSHGFADARVRRLQPRHGWPSLPLPLVAASRVACSKSGGFDSGNNTPATLNGINGNNLAPTAGAAVARLPPTPPQLVSIQGTISLLNTASPPLWAQWISMRAGSSATLSCGNSYSQGDSSNTVNCFFQLLSGPSTPAWSGHSGSSNSSPTVTVSGLLAGDYLFQLQTTDSVNVNLSGTTTLHIGANATDSNGVVVTADPAVDNIFGSMIGFGSPGSYWGLMDQQEKLMIDQQYPYQGCITATLTCPPPEWVTAGQGTISYTFCGIGGCSGGTGTTLHATITSSGLSVVVDQASVLDLSGLPTTPTTIFVETEVMLICATTGTINQQTLTVCPGGRGIQATIVAGAPSIASAHMSGVNVGQFRVTGSSTLFQTDPNTQLCPTSPGGWLVSGVGKSVYSAGTATVSPGSTTITAAGGAIGNWTNANGVFNANAQIVTIWGTTGSGATKISLVTYITALVDPSTITLNVPWPATADSGNFSYSIANTQYPAFNYTRLDQSTGSNLQSLVQACIGNTQLGGFPTHDYGQPLGVQLETAQTYSYVKNLGLQSAFGPQFYGPGLMARAFNKRSGYGPALQLANRIDDYWAGAPEIDAGYSGSIPLLVGGAVIAGIADAVLNPTGYVTNGCISGNALCNIRGFLIGAEQVITLTCYGDDSRDTGYERAWLALGAKYDAAGVSTTISGSGTTITVGSSAGIYIGQLVTGSGIPAGTLVTGPFPITGTSITISHSATSASGTATFSFQNRWIYDLQQIYNQHDVGNSACKQTDNSFSNSFLVNASGATPNVRSSGYAPLTVTTNSANAVDASGLGITADRCNIVPGAGVAITTSGPALSGTLTVASCPYNSAAGCASHGSGAVVALTGSFPNPVGNGFTNRRLIIHGTMSGQPYQTAFSYVWTNATHITINGGWPGDACTGGSPCGFSVEATGLPRTGDRAPVNSIIRTWRQAWACSPAGQYDRRARLLGRRIADGHAGVDGKHQHLDQALHHRHGSSRLETAHSVAQLATPRASRPPLLLH